MSPLETWLDGLKGTQQYYCHLLKNEDEYYAKFSTMRDESVGTSNKILVFNEVLIREMDPHVRSELHGELADLKLQMEGLLVKRRKFRVLWLLPIEKKLKDFDTLLLDEYAELWKDEYNNLRWPRTGGSIVVKQWLLVLCNTRLGRLMIN